MKKIILSYLFASVFAASAVAADGYKLKTIDINSAGKPSREYAVTSSIFSSESACKSNGAKYCLYMDLCGDRYWVPDNTAKMVSNHLGPVGRGIQLLRNDRTVCVGGKRPS